MIQPWENAPKRYTIWLDTNQPAPAVARFLKHFEIDATIKPGRQLANGHQQIIILVEPQSIFRFDMIRDLHSDLNKYKFWRLLPDWMTLEECLAEEARRRLNTR